MHGINVLTLHSTPQWGLLHSPIAKAAYLFSCGIQQQICQGLVQALDSGSEFSLSIKLILPTHLDLQLHKQIYFRNQHYLW